jgi:hypothetical protein
VIDHADRDLRARIAATVPRVAVTDTIMDDDAKAESLARTALDLALA